jgi:transposase
MGPYPGRHRALVTDNARVHHSDEFNGSLEAMGAIPLFLPLYWPELNPVNVRHVT